MLGRVSHSRSAGGKRGRGTSESGSGTGSRIDIARASLLALLGAALFFYLSHVFAAGWGEGQLRPHRHREWKRIFAIAIREIGHAIIFLEDRVIERTILRNGPECF